MFWASTNDDGCRFGHHCRQWTSQYQLNIEVDTNTLISALIYWIRLYPSTAASKKWMRKTAHHLGGVVSSNPRRWRGERLHHHSGGVCWLFVLLWMNSWRHETIVCKKWYKNNPKEGLCGVTFWPTLACTTPRLNDFLPVLSRLPVLLFQQHLHGWLWPRTRALPLYGCTTSYKWPAP